MGDSSRFSEDLIFKISQDILDGDSMVELSKAILRYDFSDDEYMKEYFGLFNHIVDEGSDPTLSSQQIEHIYKDLFIEAIAKFKADFLR
jgi:hypothetical protein